MLQRLVISDYALIERLDIDFAQGFNVLTGETGAGKSIIMGALALIMGGRADSTSVREGASKCVVEASFSLAWNSLEPDLLSDFDVDDELILRREMTVKGKSRAFVNDTPVNLQQLKEIASSILDIHSQHQNLLIERQDFQLNVIDTVAGTAAELTEYQTCHRHYKDVCKQISELREALDNSAKEHDYDLYQYNQLLEALIKEGEQEQLEEELVRLEHAEEIKSELALVSEILSDDEYGVVAKLKQGIQAMGKAAKYMTEVQDLSDALNERYIDLRELANDVVRTMNSMTTDEERRMQVELRLSAIYDLEQKHRVKSCAELLALQHELQAKLECNEHSDEEQKRLESECAACAKEMKSLADILSKKRSAVVKNIERQLVDHLVYLGIPNAKVEIAVERGECGANGCDLVEFRFSANKNGAPQPIGRIASCGEMARVMLSLKAMMAERQGLQTIIFDEIDTGVSGEMASRMGEVMQNLAANTQVIAITHLPQIASKGSTHFRVFKQDQEHSTVTNIARLTDQQRVLEVAEMLSGHNPTQSAINAAKELLSH